MKQHVRYYLSSLEQCGWNFATLFRMMEFDKRKRRFICVASLCFRFQFLYGPRLVY